MREEYLQEVERPWQRADEATAEAVIVVVIVVVVHGRPNVCSFNSFPTPNRVSNSSLFATTFSTTLSTSLPAPSHQPWPLHVMAPS